MQKGEKLFNLGVQFKKINKELAALSKQKKLENSSLEEKWATFEAQKELEKLKKDN